MTKVKVTDVLTDPEMRSHTERILALQKEERQTREELGRIIAAIGAELIAAKKALDKTSDKTAWRRWLKEHVHYSADTAQNYMRVARFTEKTEALRFFSVWIPPCCTAWPRCPTRSPPLAFAREPRVSTRGGMAEATTPEPVRRSRGAGGWHQGLRRSSSQKPRLSRRGAPLGRAVALRGG